MQPKIKVGIVHCQQATLFFDTPFIANNEVYLGKYEFKKETLPPTILFKSQHERGVWSVDDVVIGIDFHWQRTEKQSFIGDVELCVINDEIVVINHILLEHYLESVISSEMNADAPIELLKAHAIVSRSWLLAQLDRHASTAIHSYNIDDNEVVKWYDRDAHLHYDVCADDHCQRYQGITRATSPTVSKAICATWGEVLLDNNNKVCDTRFSKCCGGFSEQYENCWDDTPHPYLKAIPDSFNNKITSPADRLFYTSSPSSFCNCNDPLILKTILNNYDTETTQFYRWKVYYTVNELTRILAQRTQLDVGEVVDLIPLTRGVSGRITRLKIIGKRRTVIVGKELEIRRSLSLTHLLSSAFIVEKDKNGFILHGAGWGHGVGLCQIGASVMAYNGYSYQQILSHYFDSSYSHLTQLYSKNR